MTLQFKVATTKKGSLKTTKRYMTSSQAINFLRQFENTRNPLGKLVTGQMRYFLFTDDSGDHAVSYIGEIIKDTSERKPCSKCGQQSFKVEGTDKWQCDNCIETSITPISQLVTGNDPDALIAFQIKSLKGVL